MIKILFMFYEPTLSGISRHVLSVVKGLDRAKFSPHVLVSTDDPKIEDSFASSGAPFYRVPARKFFSADGAELASVLCAREKFDIIHLHNLHTGFWGAFAGALSEGAKVFFTPHVYHVQNPLMRGIYHKIVWRGYGKTLSRCIALTESQKRWMAAEGIVPANRITVIPNGIEDPASAASSPFEGPSPAQLLPGKTVACVVGRLTEQKNPMFLADIAVELKKLDCSAAFALAGEGPLEETLKDRVYSDGVADRFAFLGWRRDVLRIMSSCAFLVSVSRWEGMPYNVLEAFGLGRTAVVTDVDGNNDLVKHGVNGVLCKEGDAKRFAEAIAELAEDTIYRNKLATAARTEFERKYLAERMVTLLEKEYERA